jgi:hypothetical protein
MEWRIGIHLGGICISEDAFRQVRGRIEAQFADIGEQSLKNIARPLRIYRIGSGSLPEPLATPLALPLPDFTIRPRCSSIFGSTSSRRWAWSRSCVPLAHQPRVTGFIGGRDRGEAAGLGHDRVGPLVEVGDRLCSLIVTAGYRWIKSQAWISDFDTCQPLASLE